MESEGIKDMLMSLNGISVFCLSLAIFNLILAIKLHSSAMYTIGDYITKNLDPYQDELGYKEMSAKELRNRYVGSLYEMCFYIATYILIGFVLHSSLGDVLGYLLIIIGESAFLISVFFLERKYNEEISNKFK